MVKSEKTSIYPAYKDSGVPWLGDVPEHWDVVPNRALLKLKKKLVGASSPNYTLLSLTKQGVIARDLENPEGKFPASFDTYQEIESGDLIFCLFDIDETPRTVGLSTLKGMITGAYTRFECADPEAVRFIYLFYLAMDNGKHLKPLYTGLRKVITKSTFLSAKMPLPPSDEQFAIIHYLDYIDRRIRRYIRSKQKLIKLLEEQKKDIVHQAITRGLDPNVRLKTSGNQWFPEIPDYWKLLSMRRLVSKVVDGPHHSPDYVDSGIPFISARNIKADRWSLEDAKFISEADYAEFSKRVVPKIGDVLYTKGGTTGVARVVDLDYPFQVWVHVAVLKLLHDKIEPTFLATALNSPRCYEQSQLFTKGATNQDLGLNRMKDIVFPVPPISEQREIVGCLECELSKIFSVLKNLEKEISLLREYRTRLIADVVTGKLDVREATENLPEEIVEMEVLDNELAGDEETTEEDLEGEPEEGT